MLISGCVKTEFDEPPTTGTEVNIPDSDVVTIQSLKDLHVSQQIETVSELDNGAFRGKYLRGVITADDESGNFYKNFVMQDETAGIVIRQSRTDAYPFYAQGREVYIKLDGLFMGDFRGVTQLGGFISSTGELEDIVDTEEHIIAGERSQPVTPTVKKINELNRDDVSLLITLEDVEFVNGAFQLTYADAVNQNTENRDVADCDNNIIVVRTSGFADFAGTDIPDGNGTITGIYSIFESGSNVTQQLLIRSAADVDMEGERCDGSGGGGGGGGLDEPVTELFEDFNSGADQSIISLAGWSNFAVVGSRQWQIGQFNGVSAAEITAFGAGGDVEAWLITPQIDLSESRYLSFTSAFAFYAHQGLEVLISTDFDGLNPTTATWENLNPTLPSDPANEWNEYVESGNIEISGFGDLGYVAFKYTGTDPGSTTNWLVDDVCISSDPCTEGGGGGGGGGGTDDPLDELVIAFEDIPLDDNDDFSADGWTNVAVTGTRKWQFNIFEEDADVRNSAFNDTAPSMEAWLVTPAIDFNTAKQISFQNGHAFHNHDGLSTWFSNDFTGNPETATWTEIDINYANPALPNYETVSTGEVSLSQFSGIGYIGFRYVGNPDNQTTTWIIDDLSITDE